MESKPTFQLPEDEQEAINQFRRSRVNTILVKGLPHNDLRFSDLCLEAGATHVAGAFSTCWAFFDNPEKAARFAIAITKMTYRETKPTPIAAAYESLERFTQTVMDSKAALEALGVPFNYFITPRGYLPQS